MIRRLAVAAVLLVAVAGCGVSAEDEPRPIDDTLIRQPPSTPTVATRPVTTTTPPPSSTPSQSSPAPST